MFIIVGSSRIVRLLLRTKESKIQKNVASKCCVFNVLRKLVFITKQAFSILW